jgi:sulfatase modifying factor 1
MSEQRDIELDSVARMVSSGRSVIAVIGIDRYEGWRRLTNAVSDARGALAVFGRLGFEQVTGPLLDSAATGTAIQTLVMDELRTLGPDDSLVLFYAGHAGTRTHWLGDQEVKTGYLIPVDASDRAVTWIELDAWLRAVSLLPAKHILVILDACHSGIALGPIIKWRDAETWRDTPLSALRARRSRRIIASALDDQVALDSGPVSGHSLFTGCLIEALTHGLRRAGSRMITGSELGLYVQRRVETYPSSRQTPDFGTFDFDDRGEMVIPLVIERPDELVADAATVAEPPPTTSPTPRPLPTTPKLVWSAPPLVSAPELAIPQVSRDRASAHARRWVVLAVGAGAALTFVLALVAHNLRGGEHSPRPADAFPDATAYAAPDAPALSSPDAPLSGAGSQSAGAASTACPEGMVRVPAGTFRMGSPDSEGDADEHPQHEVTLSGYCIDRTEVTVAAYGACVAAKGCSASRLTVSWAGYSPEDTKRHSRWCNGPDRPEHPMNCVDWEQAAAYCQWAKKRLPTEAEWEYAARGSGGRRYPWGNPEPSVERLNACGRECVSMAKRYLNAAWRGLYSGKDGWETTAPVGTYRDGVSPFGTFDMAGNVWEWTSDWYGLYTGAAATNPKGPNAGEYRVNRGGGWATLDISWVRAANRDGSDPSNRFNDLGFRCARGG